MTTLYSSSYVEMITVHCCNCKANDKHLVERTLAFGPVGFINFGKTQLTPVVWVWFVRCKTVAFDKAGFVLIVK